jgi:hypothetical protein
MPSQALKNHAPAGLGAYSVPDQYTEDCALMNGL